MGSGKLEEALIQANEVSRLRHNSSGYAYNMACLLSCLHKDESIQWSEYAVRSSGYNNIAFAKKDPDLAWMRRTEAARFEAVTQVAFEWRIDWGLFSDDIVVTNKSPFAITNVKFTPTVKSTGYPDWQQTVFRARLR